MATTRDIPVGTRTSDVGKSFLPHLLRSFLCCLVLLAPCGTFVVLLEHQLVFNTAFFWQRNLHVVQIPTEDVGLGLLHLGIVFG